MELSNHAMQCLWLVGRRTSPDCVVAQYVAIVLADSSGSESAQRMPEEGLITRYAPIWKPLGVEWTKWGKRYWLDINGHTLGLRAGQLYGLGFLADVYPDLSHWRYQFPRGNGRKIDTHAALRHFIRKCEEAGPYEPPQSEPLK